MGRHSAPDELQDGEVLVTAAVVIDPPHRGRHARTDDEDAEPAIAPGTPLHVVAVADQTTERMAPPHAASDVATEPAAGPDLAAEPTIEVAREAAAAPGQEPAVQPATESSEKVVAARVGKGNQSTAADLELLRAHSDVRARVIAAVVAPFVIYTIAMYLGGELDVYFIWVWLPLVAAGVLAGSILDAAHRKRARTPKPADSADH
jgi:hypothetical protein